MNYKNSNNGDEPKQETDRNRLLLKKDDDGDTDNSVFWLMKFEGLKDKIYETEINNSKIDNALISFKLLIDEKQCPSIDLILDENIIIFFFDFIQGEWKDSLKFHCIVIIDRLLTYIGQPLVEHYLNELISLLYILIDQNSYNTNDYEQYSYLITKLFRSSCCFSSNFAIALYESVFFNDYVINFITKFLNYINTDSIEFSFKNIIKILCTWCQLNDLVSESDVNKYMDIYILLLGSGNAILIHYICIYILDIVTIRPDTFSILFPKNYFQLIWDFIDKNKNKDVFSIDGDYPLNCCMETLSYALLDDEIKQNIIELININLIFNMSKHYYDEISNSDQDTKNKCELLLERSFALIVNYFDALSDIPEGISLDEILNFIEDLFLNCNSYVKDCASFLILTIFSMNGNSKIDEIFSHEYLDLIFDSIPSSNDEIMEKAINVFDKLLNDAEKQSFDIDQSYFLSVCVHDFFTDLLDSDQYSSEAKSLLDQFYPE